METARTGVKRAEEELARHPEDPRPAYLGAFGVMVLGDIDGAKEWATRALAIDPDDVLTQYNVACFNVLLRENEKGHLLARGPCAVCQSGNDRVD
jgi:adenylate cyclase